MKQDAKIGNVFPTMKSQGAAKNAANNEVQVEKTAETEEKPAEKIDFSNVKIEPLFEETVDFDTFASSPRSRPPPPLPP